MQKTFIEVDLKAIEKTINTGEKLCVILNDGTAIVGWLTSLEQTCKPRGPWTVTGLSLSDDAQAILSGVGLSDSSESIDFNEIASIHIIKRTVTPMEVKS